jgi:hypothetical protein
MYGFRCKLWQVGVKMIPLSLGRRKAMAKGEVGRIDEQTHKRSGLTALIFIFFRAAHRRLARFEEIAILGSRIWNFMGVNAWVCRSGRFYRL